MLRREQMARWNLRYGTVEWTSPTGKTYVTHPGSRVLFPQWNITTGTLPPPPQMDRSHAR